MAQRCAEGQRDEYLLPANCVDLSVDHFGSYIDGLVWGAVANQPICDINVPVGADGVMFFHCPMVS